MKILLEFSRSGLPTYRGYLETIREHLLKTGHQLMNDLLKETNEHGSDRLPKEIFTKVAKSVSQAQCVVIEASEVSLSLGYILTKSISLGKPVLFLRHKNSNLKRSRFADSIKSKLLKSEIYSDEKTLINELDQFFEQNKHIKTRFNLVMPNKIDSYITQVSQSKKVSKTEYIIGLIKEDMKSGNF